MESATGEKRAITMNLTCLRGLVNADITGRSCQPCPVEPKLEILGVCIKLEQGSFEITLSLAVVDVLVMNNFYLWHNSSLSSLWIWCS